MKNPYYLLEVYEWTMDGNPADSDEMGDFPNRQDAIAAMRPDREYLLYKAVLSQKVTTSTRVEEYD